MARAAETSEVRVGPNPGPQTVAFASTADITVYGGSAGCGKALDVNTLIATPRGWSTMGELQPGDEVFAPDGTATRVVACTDVVHGRDCYDVEFSDGSVIRADGDHLWWTLTYRERAQRAKRTPEARAARRAKRPSRAMASNTLRSKLLAARNAAKQHAYKEPPSGAARTTVEIANTLTARRGAHKNHSVQVTKPLQLPERNLLVDPYVLGLWLADGTTITGVITKPDAELDGFIAAAGYECHRLPSSAMSVRVVGMTKALRELGVLGNKHIPREYLRASLAQRLALAQGLMDGDGYADPEGGDIEYTTTSPELRDSVMELLLTLGAKATCSEGRATLYGEDCGPKWRVLFMSELPMFRLERKLQNQKQSGFRGTHDQRYIVDVRRVDSVPVRCIQVEHESHCYLAGREMIPTHNSFLGLLRAGVHADRFPGYTGAVVRKEFQQLTQVGGMWHDSLSLLPMFGARPNLSEHTWTWHRSGSIPSRIGFKGFKDERDKDNFQGASLSELILDEATHVPEDRFWWLFSRLRTSLTDGFKARCLLTCNPDPDSHIRKLIDWYIGEDGLPIRDRAGKRRYFVRCGDELIWADSAAEAESLHPSSIVGKRPPRAMSLRFIPGTLEDNPRGDPGYRDKLEAMPLVERERLLGGNWNVRAAAGLVFRREWFDIIDRVPSDVLRTMRVWDRAATPVTPQSPDPDWTRGVKVSKHASGLFVVHDVVSLRGRPHEVDQLIMHTAQVDGPHVEVGFWQDPGAAGKAEAERHVKMLAGRIVHVEKASLDKETYARATSSQAEAGNVKLLRGEWNDAYLSEHQAFPDGKHDDIVDAESLGMLKLTADTWQAPVRGMVRGLRG